MKAERFYDPRLSPQQNKAIELLRNGFKRAEILDEMDISSCHLSTLYNNARKRGVDVPKYAGCDYRRGKVPIERLVEIRTQLAARGFKRAGLLRTIAERTGLTVNTVTVRLWRYDKGIRPKRAFEEGQAA